MSFGIPIVTIGGDSRKEIIKDGKIGFVINRPKNVTFEMISQIDEILIKKLY